MKRDLVTNYDHAGQYVSEVMLAAQRAASDGALAPFEYLGIGMTSVVLCDATGRGYKVARQERPIDVSLLTDEYEFLQDASRQPTIARHVARPYALHVQPLMIERECVEARPYRGGDYAGKGDDRRMNTYNLIARVMRARGWGPPEFKEDSLVHHPTRGWVLMDATFPYRIGWRLAHYVRDVLAGRRPLHEGAGVSPQHAAHTLAWLLRRDVQEGALPVSVERALSEQLRARWPGPDWESD